MKNHHKKISISQPKPRT